MTNEMQLGGTACVRPLRRYAALIAVVALVFSATPAHADHDAGTFEGTEDPPATEFTNMTTLCAEFDPDLGYLKEDGTRETAASGPLIHDLTLTGHFKDQTATGGTAEFTRTTSYFANPEGTYADKDCTNPTGLSGMLTVTFGSYSCTGPATYERRGTTVYTLSFDAPCDGTMVQFTGDQTPFATMSGVYLSS